MIFVFHNCAHIIAGLHKVSRNLRSHLKILGANRVTRSEIHPEDAQMQSIAVQNVVLLVHKTMTECRDLLGSAVTLIFFIHVTLRPSAGDGLLIHEVS
jgi:hypothetical protein